MKSTIGSGGKWRRFKPYGPLISSFVSLSRRFRESPLNVRARREVLSLLVAMDLRRLEASGD